MYFLPIVIRRRRWSRGAVSFSAEGDRGTDPRFVKEIEKGKIVFCYTDTTPLPAFPVSEVLTVQKGTWKLSGPCICISACKKKLMESIRWF